jgi:HK97 family phage major capsid protein
MYTDDDVADFNLSDDQIKNMSFAQLEARRSVVADELGKLEAYERRTQRQEAHRGALAEEFAAIVLAIGEHDIKRAQDRESLRIRSGNLGNVEHADGEATSRPYSGATRRRGSPDPTVIVRAAQRSHGDLDRVERFNGFNSDEMLRRADVSLDVLRHQGVPDEGLDKLGRLLEAIDDEPATQAQARRSNAAELVLAGSDPVYRTAFRKWIKNPEFWRNDLTSEEFAAVQRTRNAHRQIIGNDWRDGETLSAAGYQDGQYATRAALSLTGANGGFLVPLTLDPSIMLQNVGSANPYRKIARTVQTSTNTWQGVNSTGMNAQWLAEGATAADATPTFAQTILTPLKAAAWAFGSVEVLMDSDFADQLPMLLADAKDRLEEAGFATGAGTTVPFGAVVRGTALATGGGTITVANVTALHQALPARFRVNGQTAWVANIAALDLLRVLPLYTNGPPVIQGNTMPVFGEPVYESTSMDGTIAVGGHKVLMYLDGQQFIIADRVGLSVIHIPGIMAAAGNLPTYQSGFAAFWRTTSDSAVQGTSTGIRVLSLT